MILTIGILPGGASKRRVVRAVINEGSVNQCIEALFNFRSIMRRVASALSHLDASFSGGCHNLICALVKIARRPAEDMHGGLR
jgi:hypothetical protein